MKYCIKDQLSPFEFHDAELSLLSFDGAIRCVFLHGF